MEEINMNDPIQVSWLTANQNDSLNYHLDRLYRGAYWHNEGWTAEHAQMLPKAQEAFVLFLETLKPE